MTTGDLLDTQRHQATTIASTAGAAPNSSRRAHRRLSFALVGTDAAVIATSSLLAYAIRTQLSALEGLGALAAELPVVAAVLPLWLSILAALGCYRTQYLTSGSEGIRRFAAASMGGLLALGFVSFLLNLQLSRLYVALTFLFVLGLGTAGRVTVRSWLSRQRAAGRFTRNVVLAGLDDDSRRLIRTLRESPQCGYRIVAVVDDDTPSGEPALPGLPVVGGVNEAPTAAAIHGADLVIVAPTGTRPGSLRQLTVQLQDSGLDVAVAPSLYETVLRRVAVETAANVPLLHINQVRLTTGKALAKRLLDVTAASALLVALSPVMLAAAAAVRLDSPGPALFRQTRVGRNGRELTLLKFRTMDVDADDRLQEVADLNEAGHHFFKIRHDPRVTRVGRVLRRWSVDETPQLLNVLRGELSLVGPRPPLPREVARYHPWHHQRLRVKPGVTGIWQVSGRSHVPFDEAVRMDVFYIENWSLGYDLLLLARTVGAVLGRDGAY